MAEQCEGGRIRVQEPSLPIEMDNRPPAAGTPLTVAAAGRGTPYITPIG
jgi:hypothetical protein